VPSSLQTRPDAVHQLKTDQPLKPKRKWAKTAAVTALALFVAANGIFMLTPEKKKPLGSANDSLRDLWSGTGSIDLAVNGFNDLKQRPTVVLLGSSLIMQPFWAMDVDLNKKIPDIFHYHSSIAFERKLAADGAPNQRIYNFAIFGQMISDAYIYVNEYLKGDKKPDVLMFGIAPRDFYDGDLPSPTATFTFKRLVGLDNFAQYADSYFPSWQDKADWLASHVCYFYGKRWRLQHETGRVVGLAYDNLGIPNDEQAPPAPAGNNAGFMLNGSTDERWSNSAKEYRKRYHDIGNKDLSIQEGFFRKILDVCGQRHIKVVLVNMPLSEKNRSILPPGFYDKFRNTIAELAHRPGVKFIDLGPSPAFQDTDFWDTAHLNNLGGHKLIDRIAPSVVQDLAH
jgi:hypothetical protein